MYICAHMWALRAGDYGRTHIDTQSPNSQTLIHTNDNKV